MPVRSRQRPGVNQVWGFPDDLNEKEKEERIKLVSW